MQWVNRPTPDFRGFSGTVIAGEIQQGDEVIALPSGQTAKIEEIVLFEDKLDKALTDQAVTLTLDREIDLSRGDLISSIEQPCGFPINLKPNWFGWIQTRAIWQELRLSVGGKPGQRHAVRDKI